MNLFRVQRSVSFNSQIVFVINLKNEKVKILKGNEKSGKTTGAVQKVKSITAMLFRVHCRSFLVFI